MPTGILRQRTSDRLSSDGWQLGDDFEELAARSVQRSILRHSSARSSRFRRIFVSVLGISALLHAALLYLYFFQQKLPLPSSLAQSANTTTVEIELSSDVDEPLASPEPVELRELRAFHTAALERTDELEYTLNDALQRQVADEAARQQQLSTLESERSALNGQLETLTVEKADLAAQLQDERERLIALEKQLDAARREKELEITGVKGAYDRLVTALQGEIAQNSIALHQARQRLVVSILDRVLFPSGQAALTPEGYRVLEKVAHILATVTDRRIHIEGHTDNVPISPALSARFPTNWELSTARATEVVKYLLGQTHLPASRFSAVGRADTTPIASNATADGRSHNRRIEIILLPLEESEQSLS
jgi:chemotaxis protein MotB